MRFSLLFLAAALALASAEVANDEFYVRGNKPNEVSYNTNGYSRSQGKDQQYNTKKASNNKKSGKKQKKSSGKKDSKKDGDTKNKNPQDKGSYRSQRLARGYEQIVPVSNDSYGDQSNQGSAYSVNSENTSSYGNNQNGNNNSNSYGTVDNNDNS
ncbi:hypothetical protein BB560_003382, partial [Smittium megazygosporum]